MFKIYRFDLDLGVHVYIKRPEEISQVKMFNLNL